MSLVINLVSFEHWPGESFFKVDSKEIEQLLVHCSSIFTANFKQFASF